MEKQALHTDDGPKVSAEFGDRLSRLRQEDRVRALVRIAAAAAESTERRLSPRERRDRLAVIRGAGAATLPRIDAILARHDGRRLGDEPDALGFVHVETTPAGIRALAASDDVKLILEDQEIALVR